MLVPAFGFIGDGADVIVADAELAADLDVMRVFVGRAFEVADLQDGEFAQARVEAAFMPDEVCELVPGAGRDRAVHQEPVQIDVPRQQVLEFGLEIRAVEIRKPRHRVVLSVQSSGSPGLPSNRAGASGVSPPRWRASVSLPLSSQSPAAARFANVSQRSVQSPRL